MLVLFNTRLVVTLPWMWQVASLWYIRKHAAVPVPEAATDQEPAIVVGASRAGQERARQGDRGEEAGGIGRRAVRGLGAREYLERAGRSDRRLNLPNLIGPQHSPVLHSHGSFSYYLTGWRVPFQRVGTRAYVGADSVLSANHGARWFGPKILQPYGEQADRVRFQSVVIALERKRANPLARFMVQALRCLRLRACLDPSVGST